MFETNGEANILYLKGEDVQKLAGGSSQLFVDAMTNAFALHANGQFVQPLKPYLRTEKDDHDNEL